MNYPPPLVTRLHREFSKSGLSVLLSGLEPPTYCSNIEVAQYFSYVAYFSEVARLHWRDSHGGHGSLAEASNLVSQKVGITLTMNRVLVVISDSLSCCRT